MQVNHLLLLYTEVVDKILRLERFLNEEEYISLEPDIKLIKFYKDQLSGIKGIIIDPINETIKNHVDIEPDLMRQYLNTYFIVFDYIHIFHRQIDFFVSFPQIQTEVYTMIHSLLSEAQLEKIEPTVVYYYDYNFAEFNAVEYFQKKGILLDESIADRVVILLPYVDFKNPLMWISLVHEMGHALEKENRLSTTILNNLNISSRGGTEEEIEIIEKWCKEFCADMIALKLVGPAYLSSLINWLLSIHPYQYRPSMTHPQAHHRIELMNSSLNGLRSISSNIYYEIFCELTKLYNVQVIDDKNLNIYGLPKLIIPLSDLTNEIKNVVDKISFPEIYDAHTQEISLKLRENLLQGLPVSSYREKSIKDIEGALEIFSKLNQKERYENIYPLLQMVEERYGKISQILNAAWDQKAESYPNDFKTIFEKDINDVDKFNNFAEIIELNDYNIQKAIETARIHSVFVEGGSNGS